FSPFWLTAITSLLVINTRSPGLFSGKLPPSINGEREMAQSVIMVFNSSFVNRLYLSAPTGPRLDNFPIGSMSRLGQWPVPAYGAQSAASLNIGFSKSH